MLLTNKVIALILGEMICVTLVVALLLFLMWMIQTIRWEKKISKFIKENLKGKDLKFYEKRLDDYDFHLNYMIAFLKSRLSQKNFREYIKMAKIKNKIKKVTSTKGLFEIDGEIYKIPSKLEV